MTSKFSKKFPIPEKFPEILHDYAREVVRYMPKDILDFSIQYFYSVEQNIKFNYIEGGSNSLPKITNITPSLSTKMNTQNKFNDKDRLLKKDEENDILSDKKEDENEVESGREGIEDNNNLENNEIIQLFNREKIFNESRSTFSNISVSPEDKNEIRNFVGELFIETKNLVIKNENKKENV